MKKPPLKNPVKALFNALYIALVAYFAYVLIASSISGARALSGVRPAPASPAAVTSEVIVGCLADLEALEKDLQRHMDAVIHVSTDLDETPARRSTEQSWEAWSPAWRAKLLSVGARCRLEERDVPAAEPLAEVYRSLVSVHRLCTTLSVQFAQGIGPSIDELNAAMAKARQSLRG